MEPSEQPRALTEAAQRNVVAFAKLLGYVRYFHPSDEACATDWESFAINGIRAIEGARGPSGLASTLEDLFRPIAPTVRVFPTGQRVRMPGALAPPTRQAGIKAVRWHHLGLGPGGGIYHSERMRGPLANGTLPSGWRSPDRPFRAELGGGVSCLVPLTLYADREGTIPRPPARPGAGPEEPAPALVRSGNNRTTRLAAVALAWNIPQHFYPYFDVVRTDWPRALSRALRQAALDADERAFLDTMRGMVAALKDGHGRVSHPCEGELFVPAVCLDLAQKRVVVTHVAAGGPRAVRRGDVVLTVNGEPAAQAARRVGALISSATPQWKQVRTMRELLAGPKGSVVAGTVSRGGGPARSVRLRRTVRLGAVREPRPDKVAEVRPGVIYVDLDRIAQSDWDAALPALQSAQAIVFDLRGYPYRYDPVLLGHLRDRALRSPEWRLPIITQPDGIGMSFAKSHWTVPRLEPRLRARVAMLTGGGAISAAEQWVAMFEHYRLGEVVGGPTAGTNGNVNPFTTPGGYWVCWTGLKVLKHDGSQHHGVGILPTVPVSRTLEGVAAGRDEVLERAIEVLLSPTQPPPHRPTTASSRRRDSALRGR